jgi:nanoRNase/pAp phosphatase (c-di-AMP/oligoRNAs hydrolase)
MFQFAPFGQKPFVLISCHVNPQPDAVGLVGSAVAGSMLVITASSKSRFAVGVMEVVEKLLPAVL